MGRLAPTPRFDFRLAKELQGMLERLRKLNMMNDDVLLMSGSRSLRYLNGNVEELERLILKANRDVGRRLLLS
jgi:hypothetical protein